MRADIPLIDRTLAMARVDWAPSHRQPTPMRLAVATLIAMLGSLAADAILVAIGTRISSAPRALYGCLMVLASMALFLPDGGCSSAVSQRTQSPS